jgi:hypothetical protein
MTVVATATFNLDLSEIVEEAFERCGSELRTGYDLRTARRSLNLLFADWANRGINMWTIEQGQIPLVQGINTYALPVDTVDLIEHVIRTNPGVQNTQADLTISRISVDTYATIPNKLQQARPIQVWINRQTGQTNPTTVVLTANVSSTATTIDVSNAALLASTGFINLDSETIYYANVTDNQLINCARGQNGTTATSHLVATTVYVYNLPSINVWPTPDQGTVSAPYYTFVYWRLRRIHDAGNGVNTMDIPFRFLPCLIAGLAYYLALKIPGADVRLQILKQQYDEVWDLASSEDREKAPIRFVPRKMFIT